MDCVPEKYCSNWQIGGHIEYNHMGPITNHYQHPMQLKTTRLECRYQSMYNAT